MSTSERLCRNHPGSQTTNPTTHPQTPTRRFRHGLFAQGLTVRLNQLPKGRVDMGCSLVAVRLGQLWGEMLAV